MHSNKAANTLSDHDTQESQNLDNLEEFEEIESVALENTLDQYPLLLEVRGSVGGTEKLSTTGTQTPLTLIRLSVTQPSLNKQFTDSSTRFDCKTSHEAAESRENVKSFSCVLLQSKTSITHSREVTTQATPPHPSLMNSVSRSTRDTSFSSCKSEPRNEVLTVTTDYGSSSPDALSILTDAINRSGNRDLHLSVPRAYARSYPLDLAPSNGGAPEYNVSTHRTNHRRRRLTNCLRRMPAANNEPDTHAHTRDPPPTYSTICASRGRTSRNWRPFRSRNNSSFIAPTPPPSYAQSQGICLTSYSMEQLLSVSQNSGGLWSPRPTTAICPRCATIIITTIQVRQSIITHFTAFAFFLCGCWPCCMLPYCMNSCKNVDHYCPICRVHLGTYRPW